MFQSTRRVGALSTLVLAVLALCVPAQAAEKPRLRVDDYQIEAELTPHLHQINARAKVKFTALQDLTTAVFELHNDLRVTKVLDANNQLLNAERVTQDSTVRIALPKGLAKDASTTLTFEYEACWKAPTIARSRASSWPTLAMTQVTCFMRGAGFPSADMD